MKTGYIYKIVCNNTNKVYYGSTTQKVSQRIGDHRKNFNKYERGTYNYVSSFEILGGGNYQYFTVEKLEFEDKFELKNREKEYILNNECINKYIPNRTKKEWIEANRNKYLEQKKQYNEENKEKLKKQKKEWYQLNKEKIKEKYRKSKISNNII